MDVIEPLWATITTVHDLIKAHKDLSSEIDELGETVKLITYAMKPLLNSITENAGKELKEVLGALKAVLDESENTLKKIQDESKRG